MSNNFSAVVRLGRDAEIKQVGEHSVLTFTGAVNVGFGEKQSTLWVRSNYWRKADNLVQYLKKGTEVFITGELSQSEYTANDGTQKTALDLNTSSIQLVGGNKQDNQQPQQQPQQPQQQQQKQQQQPETYTDVPF